MLKISFSPQNGGFSAPNFAFFAKNLPTRTKFSDMPKFSGEGNLPSLSLSLIPGQGRAGHRPNPFQEVPEASWVGVEVSSRPDVPSGLLMC